MLPVLPELLVPVPVLPVTELPVWPTLPVVLLAVAPAVGTVLDMLAAMLDVLGKAPIVGTATPCHTTVPRDAAGTPATVTVPFASSLLAALHALGTRAAAAGAGAIHNAPSAS